MRVAFERLQLDLVDDLAIGQRSDLVAARLLELSFRHGRREEIGSLRGRRSATSRDPAAAHSRGSTCAHLARISASSALLERATIGKVARRDHGLQASMTTRALRGSSAA